MNTKKMVAASIAVFIAFVVMNYIINRVILSSVYAKLTHLWRPDIMSRMWLMNFSTLVMSIMFVYIFIKGYENKGIAEGMRFGIVAGLFISFIGIFGQYVTYPIPASLALQWFIYGMIKFIIAGVVVSLVYKPAK